MATVAARQRRVEHALAHAQGPAGGHIDVLAAGGGLHMAVAIFDGNGTAADPDARQVVEIYVLEVAPTTTLAQVRGHVGAHALDAAYVSVATQYAGLAPRAKPFGLGREKLVQAIALEGAPAEAATTMGGVVAVYFETASADERAARRARIAAQAERLRAAEAAAAAAAARRRLALLAKARGGRRSSRGGAGVVKGVKGVKPDAPRKGAKALAAAKAPTGPKAPAAAKAPTAPMAPAAQKKAKSPLAPAARTTRAGAAKLPVRALARVGRGVAAPR
jgi:hypothetical protein